MLGLYSMVSCGFEEKESVKLQRKSLYRALETVCELISKSQQRRKADELANKSRLQPTTKTVGWTDSVEADREGGVSASLHFSYSSPVVPIMAVFPAWCILLRWSILSSCSFCCALRISDLC